MKTLGFKLLVLSLLLLTLGGEIRAANLVLSSPSWVVGAASLNTTSQRNSWYLPGGSKWGNLARVYSGNNSLAESYAGIRFLGMSGPSRSIEVFSFANTGRVYNSAWSQAHTTETGANTGPSYIAVTIRPGSGESNGKRVLVTLSAKAQSSRSAGTLGGYNYYQVAYGFGNGGTFLLNRSDSTGIGQERRSTSFYSTVGSSFRVALYGSSYATKTSGSSALAVTLDMSVR